MQTVVHFVIIYSHDAHFHFREEVQTFKTKRPFGVHSLKIPYSSRRMFGTKDENQIYQLFFTYYKLRFFAIEY